MPNERPVTREWLTRHPVEVAWDLIGCELYLIRDGSTVGGRIVETEAYAGPMDPASHAARLSVARQTMAGPPGIAYVYLSYGVHTMMNVVAHREGEAGAVLLRALEPLAGLELMCERRGGVPVHRLAQGPGSLGQAMGIRLTDLGADVVSSPEWILVRGERHGPVLASPRIGISKAVHARWRFFEHENPAVSRHRRGDPVDRADLVQLIPPAGTPIE